MNNKIITMTTEEYNLRGYDASYLIEFIKRNINSENI